MKAIISRTKMRHHFSLNTIFGNGWTVDQEIDPGSIPSEANLPRVGPPMVKGLLTSADVLVLVSGRLGMLRIPSYP